ncbi:hypothetical protein JYU34_013510 [Plutella xylostella]|uniref:UDP-glucuronosyltransferase n=1 Tax=Plutella xylostella TaxID=51655 RepID=A0ABQ7QA50_PLUXY|nr:hypothetical protein JYU34_013510 [Plutella xylostella]
MKSVVRRAIQFAIVLLCLNEVSPLNILGIFPHNGKSHFFVFEPFLRELANRGHNLTVISHFPQKAPLKNYRDISLAGKLAVLEDVFPIERTFLSLVMMSVFLVTAGNDNCRLMLDDEQVQSLWKTNSKFDVVLVEQFNSDCPLGIAYGLRAPVVGLTSHSLMPWHYKRFGVPFNPSYVPFMMTDGGSHPTLYERVEASIIDSYFEFIYKFISQRNERSMLLSHFTEVPDLEELGRDIKLNLVYHNPVLTGSRLFPANIKEVGGYHVAKPKPLPDALRKFIEESEHGVIYISFGSMLKAETLPAEKLEAILGAVAELPQRVVWKFEGAALPGNPKNIYISKWLPQNDILAHPKVLAFYSHCGMLGTTEGMYHGVPMVAMPIFGDQPSNAAAIEESGLGLRIQLKELTKETLLNTLRKVLRPEFRANVKSISRAWHDQPLSPMDSAIFWTEYAARHTNITYRTRAADVPTYQYLNLDILSILVGIPLVVVFVLCKIWCSSSKKAGRGQINRKSKMQ